MYNYFYGDNIAGYKEVEEKILYSNYRIVELLNTYEIE